jgi:glycosyltransferase involved in cell wall biosynthesis
VRIGLLSPVWLPVPPSGYGGVEEIVALVADGLVDAGHDVTLFASGDSRTRATLDAIFETAPRDRFGETSWELRHALHCFLRHEEFDLIHDHSGLLGLALGSLLPTPFVHTVHGSLEGATGETYVQIARLAPSLCLVSLSLSQRRSHPELPWIANVPNALDLSLYEFSPHRGDYLLYLGRMSPEKGAHRAAMVAEDAGLPLKLAGRCRGQEEQQYFDELVRPLLGDGREYLGEVSREEKIQLLQDARATLFPVEWEEPFGLVLIESMACGTPVVATRHGAVPEVVDDGRTGIVVDDWREMTRALEAADELDPRVMRRAVEERFAPARMVADYVAVYEQALAA